MHSPAGRNGFDTQSDVYKMLQDYVEPVSEPKQSGSFKYLQGILEAEDGGKDSCVVVFQREKKTADTLIYGNRELNMAASCHPSAGKCLLYFGQSFKKMFLKKRD